MTRILNILALFLLFTHVSYAQQVHTVMNLNDTGLGSFRQLVDSAANGDTIRFSTALLNNGSATLVLESQITIDQNLTIIGLYNGNDSLYISGNNTNRLFLISAGLQLVTMDSLVLINGRIIDSNGGAINASSPLALTHCILNDNSSFMSASIYTSSIYGGAIYTSSTLTMSFCVLNGNSSTITSAGSNTTSSKGGAIYAEGLLIMNSCTLNDNSSISSNTWSAVSSSTQYSFYSNSNGGAIYAVSGLMMDDCSLNNNSVSASTLSSYLAGSTKGGSIYSESNLTMNSCVLNGNSSLTSSTSSNFAPSSLGGAIYSASTLTMDSCSLDGNSSTCSTTYVAHSKGGAIYAVSPLNMTACILTDNIASANSSFTGSWYYFANSSSGGAVYTENSLTFMRCTLNSNSSVAASYSINSNSSCKSKGGAVYASGLLEIDSCSFNNNLSKNVFVCTDPFSYGGAIYAASNMVMNSSVLNGNSINSLHTTTNAFSQGYGGAVYASSLSMSKCTLAGNSCLSRKSTGGAVYTGTLIMDSCILTDNSASSYYTARGGAIFSGRSSIKACTLTNNSSASTYTTNASYGGAIYNNVGLTVSNCLLHNNSVSSANTASGGGIYAGNVLLITNSELSSNSATSPTFFATNSSRGGAIYAVDTLTAGSCTISNNFSQSNTSTADAIWVDGRIYLYNTIVASTSNRPQIPIQNNTQTIPAILTAYNSYVSKMDLPVSNGNFDGTDSTINLHFVDPASDDFRLSPNSVLVNSGANNLLQNDTLDVNNNGNTSEQLPIDLQGATRIKYGRVDLGAYEATSIGIDTIVCELYISPSGLTKTLSEVFNDTIPGINGSDSIFTIYLVVGAPSASTINVTACGTYISPSGNHTWTSSGAYIDTIPNFYGCDSVITINLTVNMVSMSTIDTTFCGTYTSPSGNYTWTSPGTYMDTIPNFHGCDSVITINLISLATLSAIDSTVCETFTSPSGNHTWTSSGIYMDTIPNFQGCDSVITINLTVNTATGSSIDTTICGTYTSPSGNYTWTNSGTYADTIPNFHGCDSVITINLINLATLSTIDVAVCGTYTSPSGNYTWTSSGTYTDTIPNATGCDSVITINLIVNIATGSTVDTIVCGTYTSPSGNHTWTSSGIYMDTIPNFHGCDSVITINLTVKPIVDATTTLNSDLSIMANTSNAVYQWINCANNSLINNATEQTFVPLENGSYAVTVTNQEGCSLTSNCVEIESLGLEDLFSNQIKLYPNPCVNGKLTIESSVPILGMDVLAMNGMLLAPPVNLMTGTMDVSSLATGHYFVRLITTQGIVNKLVSVIN